MKLSVSKLNNSLLQKRSINNAVSHHICETNITDHLYCGKTVDRRALSITYLVCHPEWQVCPPYTTVGVNPNLISSSFIYLAYNGNQLRK